MASNPHLSNLEGKHQVLDREIVSELARPARDSVRITELKRRKLRLKEEIERIRQQQSLH